MASIAQMTGLDLQQEVKVKADKNAERSKE
jgi:hypothetical protein